MTNRITEQVNGTAQPAGGTPERLAMLEKAQAEERKLRGQYADVITKLDESILIRSGRIDELRRVVMAQAQAKAAPPKE